MRSGYGRLSSKAALEMIWKVTTILLLVICEGCSDEGKSQNIAGLMPDPKGCRVYEVYIAPNFDIPARTFSEYYSGDKNEILVRRIGNRGRERSEVWRYRLLVTEDKVVREGPLSKDFEQVQVKGPVKHGVTWQRAVRMGPGGDVVLASCRWEGVEQVDWAEEIGGHVLDEALSEAVVCDVMANEMQYRFHEIYGRGKGLILKRYEVTKKDNVEFLRITRANFNEQCLSD